MRRTRMSFVALLVPFVAAAALGADPPAEDPFARHLFPPDQVLAHARASGLEDAQRQTIRAELQKAQARFLDLQLDLQAESEKMIQLLEARPVDEAKVLAEADRVMSMEREIKRTQLTLLIRVKNLLTPAQQAKLQEVRRPPSS